MRVAILMLVVGCVTTPKPKPDILDATLECTNYQVWHTNSILHENCD